MPAERAEESLLPQSSKNGAVPPKTFRLTVPSFKPKQLIFVIFGVILKVSGSVIIMVSNIVQPFPSLIEKGYEPAGIPTGDENVVDPRRGKV